MLTDAPQTWRPLHIYIDASLYDIPHPHSPRSSSPSTAVVASPQSLETPPTSAESELISSALPICTVLCMYDLHTDDPDQLSFSRGDLLDIVRKEMTGWWAAMRQGSDLVGWVPEAFVRPLSLDMAEKLESILPELRIYEYEAEELYLQAPVSQSLPIFEDTPLHGVRMESSADWETANEPQDGRRIYQQPLKSENSYRSRPFPPPSPTTPMPYPPESAPSHSHHFDIPATGDRMRDRADTIPGSYPPRQPNNEVHPRHNQISAPNSQLKDVDVPRPSENWSREEKIRKLTGSDEAWIFLKSVQARNHIPWYLRPEYVDQIEMDSDGQVRLATLEALVEKLAVTVPSNDPLKNAQDTKYRNTFLMTFRTFMIADQLFDMLVDTFRKDHPRGLTSEEFEDWKTRYLIPTQQRILTIFTAWLQYNRLLEEEPHISRKLTEFLKLIVSPPSLMSMAKGIIQMVERLTFAEPINLSPAPVKKPKKAKSKGEIAKLDPTDIAEQLTLIEYKLYTKVTPQECIAHKKSNADPSISNLFAFCATHDKLDAWVKTSILNTEALGKRAYMVDFWIKVAEKCRSLNNFSSMSAIINALSSTVITQLHLTWAHTGRKANLDALLKYSEPTGGFSGYRKLLSTVEGPCIPFIGMYLTDIAHIHDQYQDEGDWINFRKRQQWYEAISAILRYQSKPYSIVEDDSISTHILSHLRDGGLRDGEWFWIRSDEVQRLELAHADIRKGLVEAGF